jgi:hypothetical protein
VQAFDNNEFDPKKFLVGSGIWKKLFPDSDPAVEKAPDPGSRFATLDKIYMLAVGYRLSHGHFFGRWGEYWATGVR